MRWQERRRKEFIAARWAGLSRHGGHIVTLPVTEGAAVGDGLMAGGKDRVQPRYRWPSDRPAPPRPAGQLHDFVPLLWTWQVTFMVITKGLGCRSQLRYKDVV
jgi:hypothetical protein